MREIIAAQETLSNSLYFVLTDETDLSTLPDGIYPLDSSVEWWIVISDGKYVAKAREWGVAALQVIALEKLNREHVECDELVDGDELVFASGIEWPGDDYGLSEAAL